MGHLFVSTCLFLLAASGSVVQPEKLTPQETFFLRRMNEFWKDRDFALVKKQILEFLTAHPQSAIHDNLHAILADIFYQEKDYSKALEYYEKIVDSTLQQKSITRKCQCLYILEKFDAVISALSPVFKEETQKIDFKQEMQFILADSLYRKMKTVDDVDQQKTFATEAKPLFLSLYDTTYKEKVLLPLAEVHRTLGDHPAATNLFTLLAEKMPEKKEEILLQIATLQLNYNRSGAIDTYQQIVDMGKSKAPDAAYNELLLLFQDNRFADLINRASAIATHLPWDRKPLFDFCLGRSHYKLEHYKDAILYFDQFIQAEQENTPYKRAAFLTLISCAKAIDDTALFDRVLENFLISFPKDEEAGKALLLHAQTALQSGNLSQASRDLGRLLSEFPEMPEYETLLYDHALLLSKTKQWDESRSSFFTYLNRYPQSPHFNLIWSSIVHCSVESLKEAPLEKARDKKAQLAEDLHKALAQSTIFTNDEQASYQFLLGQLYFDLDNPKESLTQLSAFTAQYPSHPSVPQALLLQTHIHRHINSPPEAFIETAEKALAVVSDFENKTALRLQLFNSYIVLQEFEKAADHLYATFAIDQVTIQQENQLWLAHYYFDGAKRGNFEKTQRAFKLFSQILKMDENYHLGFDPEQTYLEAEVLKFAELLSVQDKKKLLVSLREFQSKHSDQPWKHTRQTVYELGKTHLSLNEQDEALKLFEELTAVSDTISSAASLEKNRILFSRCADCDRNENNPVVAGILSSLKDLQIQKRLVSEPLHLEAALEYADVRISLAPPAARKEAALFFLNRVKDDFNAKDDPIGRDYHEARIRFPEKDTIFHNYMKCLEAEIFQIEAEIAKEQNDLEKAEKSGQLALALLEEVLQDIRITDYLKHRAEALKNKS